MVAEKVSHKQEVADALIALENERGQITPELVVEAAAAPQSPLHKAFTWNDEEAAYSYRLDQARALIRSVEYEITIRRKTVTVGKYVRDVELPVREPGYRSIPSVIESGLQEATLQAEIARVLDLIARARRVAVSLDKEDEFVKAIRAAL